MNYTFCAFAKTEIFMFCFHFCFLLLHVVLCCVGGEHNINYGFTTEISSQSAHSKPVGLTAQSSIIILYIEKNKRK